MRDRRAFADRRGPEPHAMRRPAWSCRSTPSPTRSGRRSPSPRPDGSTAARVITIGMALFFVAAILLRARAERRDALRGARARRARRRHGDARSARRSPSRRSPPERRGAALSFVILGLTLAQVGGIPVGSFLGYTAGWRATFWMVGGDLGHCLRLSPSSGACRASRRR